MGIWAPNCAEWVVLQFATAKAGAILVRGAVVPWQAGWPAGWGGKAGWQAYAIAEQAHLNTAAAGLTLLGKPRPTVACIACIAAFPACAGEYQPCLPGL